MSKRFALLDTLKSLCRWHRMIWDHHGWVEYIDIQGAIKAMSIDLNSLKKSAVCLGLFALAANGLELGVSQEKTQSIQVGAEAGTVEAGTVERLPAALVPQDQEKEPPLRKFMRQKLDASNRILEGLVTDNMPLVESGSEVLLKMGREEKWRISNDMLYRRYSTEFIDAVNDMKEKAAANSIDGASLAWIKSTMTCLKCHEWVRNTIIAENADAVLRVPEGDLAVLRQVLNDSSAVSVD